MVPLRPVNLVFVAYQTNVLSINAKNAHNQSNFCISLFLAFCLLSFMFSRIDPYKGLSTEFYEPYKTHFPQAKNSKA